MKRRGRISRVLTPRLAVLLDCGSAGLGVEGASDEELEQLWFEHREWMLSPERRHWPGDRPCYWWLLESGAAALAGAAPKQQAAWLAEHDLLDADEVVALTRRKGA